MDQFNPVDDTAGNTSWADTPRNSNEPNLPNWNILKSSFQLAPAATPQDKPDGEVDPESFQFVALYQSLQLWHFLDLLVGLLVIIYGGCIASSPTNSGSIVVFLILGVGFLVLSRAVAGALHLSTENRCHKCGLTISAGTSPILASIWFVLMFTNLVVPGKVHSYLQEHNMLWPFLQDWEGSHKQTTTLILLGACLLEVARYKLVQSLHQQLTTLEASESARARERSVQQWNDRHDPLTESLLPASEDPAQQSAKRPWVFLGRPRRPIHQYGSVREHTTSVDFDSPQEEDPYWWSRGEANAAAPATPTAPPADAPTNEPSWAKNSKVATAAAPQATVPTNEEMPSWAENGNTKAATDPVPSPAVAAAPKNTADEEIPSWANDD